MNRKSSRLPAAALGFLVAVPAAVYADAPIAPNFYLGGGAGYLRLEEGNFPNQSDDVDDGNVSYRGYLGGRFNRFVGIEGAYTDFGTAEGGDNEVEAHGFTASVVGYVPLSRGFEPYGKIGQLFWDKTQKSNIADVDTDGDDVFFGVGGRFALTERTDFKLEYDRFTLDDADVDMASANLQFNF